MNLFWEQTNIFISFIGLFSLILIGIKKFSEYYQILNDEQIQRIINNEKQGSSLPFLTGLSLATLIQSSTLVVGLFMNFMHAKFMKIERSFFLVWGANIGATIGLWVLVLPGQIYAFELLGIGFLLTLLVAKKWFKYVGQLILGLGLIFLSLKIFEEYLVVSQIKFSILQEQLSWRQVVLGLWCLSAAFILPSPVMLLAPLISLISLNLISLEKAFILTLLVNFGSSLKAITYIKMNKHNSDLLGYMHILLNLINFWVFLILILCTDLFTHLFGHLDKIAMAKEVQFVFLNTMYFFFMGWAVFLHDKYIEKYKVKEVSDELTSWPFDKLLIPAIPLLLAKEQIRRLVDYVSSLISISDASDDLSLNAKNLGRIKLLEGKTDVVHEDLRNYLSALMKRKLNLKQSAEALGYLRMADDLENLADYLDKIATLQVQFNDFIDLTNPYWVEYFAIEKELFAYYSEISPYFKSLDLNNKADFISRLDILRERTHTMKKGLNSIYSVETGPAFADMYQGLNKIRTHMFRLTEELALINKQRIKYYKEL